MSYRKVHITRLFYLQLTCFNISAILVLVDAFSRNRRRPIHCQCIRYRLIPGSRWTL